MTIYNYNNNLNDIFMYALHTCEVKTIMLETCFFFQDIDHVLFIDIYLD